MADATRTLEVEIISKGVDALMEIAKSFESIAKESSKADSSLKKVDKTTTKAGKSAKSTQDKLGTMASMFRDMDGIGGELGDTLDRVSVVMSGKLGLAIGGTVAAIGGLVVVAKTAIDAVSAFAEANAEAGAKFSQLSTSLKKTEVTLGEVITRFYAVDTAASALSVILDATYNKWLDQAAGTMRATNGAERLSEAITLLGQYFQITGGAAQQAIFQWIDLGSVVDRIAGSFYNAANAAEAARRQIKLNQMAQAEFERVEAETQGGPGAGRRAAEKRLAAWQKSRGFTSYEMARQTGVVNNFAEWQALQGGQVGPQAMPPTRRRGGGGGGRRRKQVPGLHPALEAFLTEAPTESEFFATPAVAAPSIIAQEFAQTLEATAAMAGPMKTELDALISQLNEIDLVGGRLKSTFDEIGFVIGQTLGRGMLDLAGGLASTFGAFAVGQATISDFGDVILGTFGDMAGQLGQFFVKTGLAMMFMPGGVGSGVGLIAGGLALQALGGAMGASASGGNQGAATGRGGSQVAPSAFTPMDMRQTEQQRTDNINITIEGDTIARAVDNSARRGVMRHLQVRFA